MISFESYINIKNIYIFGNIFIIKLAYKLSTKELLSLNREIKQCTITKNIVENEEETPSIYYTFLSPGNHISKVLDRYIRL